MGDKEILIYIASWGVCVCVENLKNTGCEGMHYSHL